MSPADTTVASGRAPVGEPAHDTPDYGDAMSVEVRLRPFEQGEFATATEQEAEYDDFGPTAGFASPPPCRLDAQGALAVEADGELVGMVSWVWQRWGPNAGSRNPIIGIWLLADAPRARHRHARRSGSWSTCSSGTPRRTGSRPGPTRRTSPSNVRWRRPG